MVLLLASLVATATAFTLPAPRRATAAALRASQLEQLAEMTTLSIDTGDLDVIAKYADTGLVTDATTNPLFVAQAGTSGDARYVAFVDAAIAYAKEHAGDDGVVDIRASFDTDESVRRARRIIAMYEAAASTGQRARETSAGAWEGIKAAEILEKEGITCNITLIFGFAQAVAAAQAGAAHLAVPGASGLALSAGGEPTYEPADDPGVVEVSRIYAYYKKHGHGTICMPASWRPSRGTGDPAFAVDEILALAGTDRMTIPPAFLDLLQGPTRPCRGTSSPRPPPPARQRSARRGARLAVNGDMATTTKLAEGIGHRRDGEARGRHQGQAV
ncbi:sedoheptulose-7-phosphate:D-glyceraldehyde-3-phosphate glyceronetransferase [Aureococcus anophagefferens]|nr:sedoheptulose-7-phosphate:D-glyceraldehyde-3-phosphate glyceronetransferase [Aureococcus anophagefferens]